MSEKPSYLGMLNAIYMGEQRGYEYLSAWADVTPDPDVRAVLRTIALREGEHALAFAKRINELGFEARDDGPSDGVPPEVRDRHVGQVRPREDGHARLQLQRATQAVRRG